MESPRSNPVRVYHGVTTSERFHEVVYPSREPAVCRGIDLGPCCSLWQADYLAEKCGELPVQVHVSPDKKMNFVQKNFMYKTMPFNKFIQHATHKSTDHFICPEECFYLRSLGNNPRKDVANFPSDYPLLAPDINLPLLFPAEKLFSSVFRVSSPGVQLWTHYDVMDNLLVQVTGRKRVVLFPPSEVPHLYLSGDKSRVVDIDTTDTKQFPLFTKAQRYECCLDPGDVLFIPALWFHNVTYLDFGAAVNVFWKHLDPQYYDTKDIYGNKDPPQVQRSFQVVDRALKLLEELPKEEKEFYTLRLIARVEEKMRN